MIVRFCKERGAKSQGDDRTHGLSRAGDTRAANLKTLDFSIRLRFSLNIGAAPRYLLCDRDTFYGSNFCERIEVMRVTRVLNCTAIILAERLLRARS
jgi:hypothetical protein